MATMKNMDSFWQGFREACPLIPGMVPFAMIYGVSAMNAGLGPVKSWLMSLLVFAGAAQLAALQLHVEGAPILVMVMTALAMNLRFVMYSASLAPHFSKRPLWLKLLISWNLTDLAYARSIAVFEQGYDEPKKGWYFMGSSALIWLVWQGGTLAGVLLGAELPAGLEFGFAVPLTFMAILTPVLVDRPNLAAALVAGGVALLLNWLPYNLGLIAAALCGIFTGYLLEKRMAGRG